MEVTTGLVPEVLLESRDGLSHGPLIFPRPQGPCSAVLTLGDCSFTKGRSGSRHRTVSQSSGTTVGQAFDLVEDEGVH